MEDKHKRVREEGVDHWDEYQSDLDETHSAEVMAKINYRSGAILFILSVLMIVAGGVLAVSIPVNIEDVIYIRPSAFGFCTLVLASAISGFIIGKAFKKPYLVYILALVALVIGLIMSAFIGPELIPGVYETTWQSRVISLFIINSWITLITGHVGTSYYFYN